MALLTKVGGDLVPRPGTKPPTGDQDDRSRFHELTLPLGRTTLESGERTHPPSCCCPPSRSSPCTCFGSAAAPPAPSVAPRAPPRERPPAPRARPPHPTRKCR